MASTAPSLTHGPNAAVPPWPDMAPRSSGEEALTMNPRALPVGVHLVLILPHSRLRPGPSGQWDMAAGREIAQGRP